MAVHGNGNSSRATLRDCVYGAAIGDALGVPHEFKTRGSFECTDMDAYGTHEQPAGTFSDDTSMMLATCDSIRAKHGRIDTDDIRARFGRWLNCGDYTVDGTFDVGNTTATAIIEGRGGSSVRNNGNGSLMRIAPLAFTDADDAQVEAVSAITHAHAISTQACVIYVHIARELLEGADASEAVADAATGLTEPFERLGHLDDLSADEISSGGYVVHTLEAALWCLLKTDSYAQCVLEAVNLGSDTDTTACVAGALAGIVYGLEGIPAKWADTLRGTDIIERCLFQRKRS